jgi:peptide/nickel transport system ATP-binding protein
MMEAIEKPVLSVRGLSVSFSTAIAVHDVSFDIYKGEVLALVGESGCGKSMTAFSIMHLLPPSATIIGGRIWLGHRELSTLSPASLRDLLGNKISLILQEPMSSLNPVMTVGRQVAEVLMRHQRLSPKAARARVLELFGLVGIPHPDQSYDQHPHTFSGGMRQRVMIAMAIACSPQLLIADEPTTALDVTVQAQVMGLLDRLRRELDMSVLLITHDLGIVAQWADRVAVMYAGRIVEQATVSEFFRAPKHPYSHGLLGSLIPEDRHYTSARLNEISGTVASAVDELGCSFAPRCPLATAICTAGPPPLVPLEKSHLVACYKATC